jgi:ubiquinone/menaquinone biosynthesis C-methylase UbiE
MTEITRRDGALELRSGGTTLTLDKAGGKAVMQRKVMFVKMKPTEMTLSDIAEIKLDVGVDRASGVEICNAMLVSRAGSAWALPAADKKDAEKSAAAMREFLGLG